MKKQPDSAATEPLDMDLYAQAFFPAFAALAQNLRILNDTTRHEAVAMAHAAAMVVMDHFRRLRS